MSGLQCPKLLWYLYNDPKEIPPTDAAQQAIFEQGHLVGDYAKQLYPNGITIDHTKSFQAGLQSSIETLKKNVPIFEGAFSYNNGYARADILQPNGDGSWDLIEVKSSTSVKDEYYLDIGFQYYVYTGAGINIDKCQVLFLNNSYIYDGQLDIAQLFKSEDITAAIKDISLSNVENKIEEMQKVIQQKECPEISISDSCTKPYECPLKAKCWAFLPKSNVLTLYRNKKLGFANLNDGVLNLADIPISDALNDKHLIQVECAKTNRPYVDRTKINDFLKTLEYPVHYMDFETFSTAIPMFNKTKPYQQIPFQFSMHIQKTTNSNDLEHYSFLADGNEDPRSKFLSELKSVIGDSGSIVAYNADFELTRLKECAEAFPEYLEWVESLKKRIVDLLLPFRDFAYYHPDQQGSCSIKKVLPVLTKLSYENMEIGEGGKASSEYFRVTFTEDNQDRAKVRKLLEEYCKLDTLAMVEIIEALKKLSSK